MAYRTGLKDQAGPGAPGLARDPPGGGTLSRMVRLALVALTLGACKPAPPEAAPVEPPAAPPVAARGEPPVTKPTAEPPPEEPAGCLCPAPATAELPVDASDEELDEEPGKRRARAKKSVPAALAARVRAAFPGLRPACDVALSGPCAVRGDLDGDGKIDDVVLVRSSDGAGGLAILWAAGTAELLGAGRRGQCWTTTEVVDLDGTSDVAPCPAEVDADLRWIAHWELHPRKLGARGPAVADPRRRREYPAPGVVGDGLYLSGSDAAAVLYRAESGWILMHLGF